jgi:hypothetical protein
MIEPERILYYFEHVALLFCEAEVMGEAQEDGSRPIHYEWSDEFKKSMEKFLSCFYIFCHVGTASMHKCQHPDWEEMFLKWEKEMIDSGHMKPYDVRKQEGPLSSDALDKAMGKFLIQNQK